MNRFKSLLFPPPPGGRYNVPLLILRVVVGAAFMFHGWSKIQNPFGWMGESSSTPALFQGLAALSEFGGGLAWVLGLLTPLASAGILCTMTVAVWTHAIVNGNSFVGKPPTYELALVYAAIAVTLMVCGPGRFALDGVIRGRTMRDVTGN
jgi:putative oxidoreductase